jgi:DNA helicase II / ATP-dependent DNA helicase PcrA
VKLIADLHIHSRFSRATSKELDFVALHRSALMKGIGLVGTGDFTHPGWMAEIEDQLVPAEEGWFKLRPDLQRVAEEAVPASCRGEVRFVLEVEISNIYKKAEKTRKNHNLVFVPTIEAAKRFTGKLATIGNLASDGRPILGLDARNLLEITLQTDPMAFLIPAHIWTPWFSLLGSKSGFDSVNDCFGDLAGEIFAVETGLSSDPPMNWRVAELDRMTLVSNSDAHSPAKLGREANLLDIEPGYSPMLDALKTGRGFCGTLEFFPEHGKYHLDGHRKCKVRLSPEETREHNGRCPTCGGLITVGVMSRVMDLAEVSRPEGFSPPNRAGFRSLVPLDETAAEVLAVGAQSRRVVELCERILRALGPELYVLKDAPLEDIESAGGFPIREAIRRIRCGDMAMEAGFDGEFGSVRVFTDKERSELVGQTSFLPRDDVAAKSSKTGQNQQVKQADERSRADAIDPPPPSQETSAERDVPTGFNADQAAVIAAERGPIVVSAGPGTGKTKTLTERIVHHVRSGAWKRERVLALTFTNQAADELLTRLNIALGGCPGQGPTVTTFHAFGRSVLQTVFGRKVVVVEDDTRLALMVQALGGDAPKRRVEQMLDAVSQAKQCPDPSAAITDAENRAVYTRYQSSLEEQGLLDLDDLVLKAYAMLAEDRQAAERLAASYDSISVDEYQDVNDLQAAWIKLLSPQGNNLLVIGDPDQAIYGFRGARPGHFIRFAQSFPNVTVRSLDTTYRLPTPILEVAQAILGTPRALRSSKSGPKVEVVSCPSEAAEAEQLLVRIEQLIGGTSHFALNSGRAGDAEEPGLGFGDIAVLCRLKAQRTAILTALSRSGLPCMMVGEDEPHDPRSEKVAIMTMHASKGREYQIVFIVGVEPCLMPLELAGLASDPEEERRLLYVAATRAKRRLIVSHAKHRMLFGRQLPGGPSPFLARLPAKCVSLRAASLKHKPQSKQLGLF